MHAGLVDLSTFSVVNLFLASAIPAGDWLVVHVRPDYTSIAIMRGGDLIFFRNRGEGEDEALADVVHQTTMYYQDRLSGQGFARVLARRIEPDARQASNGVRDLEAGWSAGRADRPDAGGGADRSHHRDA